MATPPVGSDGSVAPRVSATVSAVGSASGASAPGASGCWSAGVLLVIWSAVSQAAKLTAVRATRYARNRAKRRLRSGLCVIRRDSSLRKSIKGDNYGSVAAGDGPTPAGPVTTARRNVLTRG